MSLSWLAVVAFIVCTAASAFLSAGAAALMACARAGLVRLEKQGERRARMALRLFDARERTALALLVGKAFFDVTACVLVAGVLALQLGGPGIVYAAVMVPVVVVFTGVLPALAATRAPERALLRLAGLLARGVRWLSPALAGCEALSRAILRPLQRDRADAENQADEDGAEPQRAETPAEQRKRDRDDELLDLSDLTVSDVMVHRTEMVTVDADEPAADIVAAVLKSRFTRVPLWRGSPENIIGVLHVKDLLRAVQAAEGDLAKIDIPTLLLPLWFVPDIRPLAEQLKAFRRRKTHFALVVDEYGEVEGLVTLEDILEEIVGDISDEHDKPVPGVQPQPDGSVNVEGAVPIRDLNRAMDWSLPDSEATTIAGLVIHEARSIPAAGQSFTFHGFRFRVLRKERNRIAALRITPLPTPAGVSKAG